jgi:hypothetical protein
MKVKLEIEQEMAVMFVKLIQHVDPTNFVFPALLSDIDNQIADQLKAVKVEEK